ncbi:TMEM165/GDT1 family protein [Rhodococcoides corynebacterioides]|uniref:GDT1 family protein n=1 Tax=Rhodococcoides corynebacterioides TaxID=53972 RepID=A0ABS7P3N8_9NOCA|nr:TMEM165/GDT1 family protein [Rhodococcus corynebacterioides]MBY6367000.1 TMEM165/GDT1 family protein [Rhodococcus corynebacterioides]MBY6407261.1 TMEM165/GDT1 family protein [Rhodococcus corynebacterioides]
MLAALLLSFGVIFVAELGDKSQLMAMTFALKYRWWVVVGGITLATTVVHLVSVAVGHSLGVALPTHLIGIVGGVAFLVFGLWTLRGDSLDEDEKGKADRVTKSAFIAVASAFFLAELGDKTMLATVTLAADNDWVGVWIGSTLGMVAADALAIVVGATLGKRLPERLITLGAATLFFVFGVWLILEGVFPTSSIGIVAAVVVLALGSAFTTWRMRTPVAAETADSAESRSR